MNTLSKLTLISVMISAMAGCSVRKDGNNLSNVTTADSLLFTEPLDTLPDGVISSVEPGFPCRIATKELSTKSQNCLLLTAL